MAAVTRAQALALVCGMMALMPTAARADDDDNNGPRETRNPGFAYRISNGTSPGTIVVTLTNDTGVPQRVFRVDPGSQDQFVIFDERHRRVRHNASPPLGAISVSSRGTTLQVGESLATSVDLSRWFALKHGERYTAHARGYVSYNPGNGPTKTFTSIDAKPVSFTY
jgi:hypothetical protein